MGKSKHAKINWETARVPEITVLQELLTEIPAEVLPDLHVFAGELVEAAQDFSKSHTAIMQVEWSNDTIRKRLSSAIQGLSVVKNWAGDFSLYRRYQEGENNEWNYSLKSRKLIGDACEKNLAPMIDLEWFQRLFGVRFSVSVGDDFRQKSIATFCSRNPDKILVAVVTQLTQTLEEFQRGFEASAQKGGPKPRVVEPWVIENLADFFSKHRLGEPTYSPEGRFHVFVEQLIESFGLQNSWVISHLEDGVKSWKSRKSRPKK